MAQRPLYEQPASYLTQYMSQLGQEASRPFNQVRPDSPYAAEYARYNAPIQAAINDRIARELQRVQEALAYQSAMRDYLNPARINSRVEAGMDENEAGRKQLARDLVLATPQHYGPGGSRPTMTDDILRRRAGFNTASLSADRRSANNLLPKHGGTTE